MIFKDNFYQRRDVLTISTHNILTRLRCTSSKSTRICRKHEHLGYPYCYFPYAEDRLQTKRISDCLKWKNTKSKQKKGSKQNRKQSRRTWNIEQTRKRTSKLLPKDTRNKKPHKMNAISHSGKLNITKMKKMEKEKREKK